MLIQFTVENFCSLKEETVLSMATSSNKEHLEYIREYKNEGILPVIAIHGANAAGKSNIFKAMTAAIMVIRSSEKRQVGEQIPYIVPFVFDKKTLYKPTHFDFIFTTKKSKYQYGFSADSKVIYEEYLYEYKTERPSLIFERTNISDYKFTQALSKEFREIKNKNTDNKLFISTATAWNSEITRDAYLWFSEGINTFDETIGKRYDAFDSLEKEDKYLRPFINILLKNADINISDYSVETETEKYNDISLQDVNNMNDKVKKTFRIYTKHNIKNGDNIEEYELPLNFESKGTQQLFFLGPIIKHALDRGETIVIDELDRSLHPLLVDYVISIFNNKESNPNNAQLIFNVHSTHSLNLDIFRRDQIYFVDKDDESGVSELYSLDDFSVRKNENINKNYLIGRYGAIPEIGIEDLM